MRGLIVVNSTSKLISVDEKVESLVNEFSKRSIAIDVYKASELNLSYKNSSYQMDLKYNYDFCIFLDKDKYLAHALSTKMRLFNNPNAIINCDDKMLTYQILNSHNIKTPLTIPSPLNYKNTVDETFLNHVKNTLSYPLVAKKVYGSLGKDVCLINSDKELLDFYTRFINFPHIYQEYIGYKFGTDYRVITIDKKVVAAMERRNDNDFRSNIALGGHGRKITLTQDYIELAEKVSTILDLDYAGIDILSGRDGEPILNEVNSNAFFKEIESVSKINISSLLVDYIIDEINHNRSPQQITTPPSL